MRPNPQPFTQEQEEWLCDVIGHWYLDWKDKITGIQNPHRLGVAKEELKILVCNLIDDKEGALERVRVFADWIKGE